MSAARITEHESKAFLLSAVALSASLFSVAFWYGVFGTFFFEQIFFVWVAATVALLTSLFIPRAHALPSFVAWRGRILLLVPSLWLVLQALETTLLPGAASGPWYWGAAIVSAALTMPYLIYVLVLVAVPDVDSLSHTRLKVGLIAIAALMAGAGFAIGRNHPLFLTCQDFKVAGDEIPENCRSAAHNQAQRK